LSIVQSLFVIANGSVSISKRPASSGFTNFVAKLLSDCQMSLMVINGCWKFTEQRVSVAQAVAGLRLDGSLTKLDGKIQSFPKIEIVS
jgi:hypothetical protein